MSNNEEFKLKEECGVFAIFENENATMLTTAALHALQHRGQDSTGMSWFTNGKVKVHKAPGLVSDVVKRIPSESFEAKSMIGHVRYATTGGQDLSNIHPFVFSHSRRSFALAHNGNISNSSELRVELEKMGTVFWGESDSEITGHFIVREEGTMIDAIKNTAKKLEGAFSFVFIDEHAIYALRDKIGFRPLSIGKINGSYMIASESVAFDVIGGEKIRDVQPGEIVRISKDGIESYFYEENRKPQLDAMELIYFARPDSVIDGVLVQEFRKRTGEILAEESPSTNCDLVVPVPDSSIDAALGYSEKSHIPLGFGLVKNRYVARTFIQPSQAHRELDVNKKLNASSIVKGKKLVLIDDSIVRGTTLKRIVEILKNAGAKEVHIRIASPMIIAPSYYGINISTYKELFAHNFKDKASMAKELGADSLEFITIEGLKNASPNLDLETCIFTNKYQTKISQELLDKAVANE